MKPLPKYLRVLCIVSSVIVVLCVFSQANPTPAGSTGGGKAMVDKCKIDLASPQDCSLSKAADDRIIWINNSGSDMYVCFDPKSDPFEGYAFYVPPNDKRKSGKITDSTNPSATPFTYSISATPCPMAAPQIIRTNPKIIIGN
jgi:hypothetical protein